MATCPNCGANSRTDPTFEVTSSLVAKPLGTFSVAGVQPKTVATARLRLTHARCGWSIYGHIDGEEFIGDPTTEVFPPCGSGCGGCSSCC